MSNTEFEVAAFGIWRLTYFSWMALTAQLDGRSNVVPARSNFHRIGHCMIMLRIAKKWAHFTLMLQTCRSSKPCLKMGALARCQGKRVEVHLLCQGLSGFPGTLLLLRVIIAVIGWWYFGSL